MFNVIMGELTHLPAYPLRTSVFSDFTKREVYYYIYYNIYNNNYNQNYKLYHKS